MTTYIDFTRDSRHHDGAKDSPFAVGSLVDDLVFFAPKDATPWIDNVVLFDRPRR